MANREEEEDEMIGGGSMVFTSQGIAFFIGGIVMSVIMDKTVKEYKSRLEKI